MVFALGGNLDYSSADDIQRSLRQVEKHHDSWTSMMQWARSIRADMQASSQKPGASDFPFILEVAQAIVAKYSTWQSHDCSHLEGTFHRLQDPGRPGHVSWDDAQQDVNHSLGGGATAGRVRFNEPDALLRDFGVLEENSTVLIVPNYLYSQSMCVSTSSYFGVCCPNFCEGLLARLEKEIGAPTAEPEQILRILEEAQGPAGGDGQRWQHQPLREHSNDLRELHSLPSNGSGGRVSLHSREFSAWLHHVYPTRCPKPVGRGAISPKTADEWMGDPEGDVEVMERMLEGIGMITKNFIDIGVGSEAKREGSGAPRASPSHDVIWIHTPPKATLAKNSRKGIAAFCAHAVLAVSTLCMLVSAIRSGIQMSVGHHDDFAKKNGAATPEVGKDSLP